LGFYSAKHPTMTFSADKFSFNGDKVSEVAGSLTMLGKTLPVVLKATNFNCYDHPMLKREVCGGDFETTIMRSQWGMNWGIDFGIPDKVKLLIQVEAVKQ
jgi:polyisoprenoid-binding protein YceI